MTKDEALRLALEVLADLGMKHYENTGEVLYKNTYTAIKAALEAKDEPEYYGLTKDHLWMSISKEHYDRLKPEFRMACYTTPLQRKPLTEEKFKHMPELFVVPPHHVEMVVRAIEAAHQIYEDKK